MRTTSWLPSRFAVLGKVLRLQDNEGNWEDGWHVVHVSTHCIDEEHAVAMNHLWKIFSG